MSTNQPAADRHAPCTKLCCDSEGDTQGVTPPAGHDPARPSGERDRLDGDEHARNIGAEAHHRPRRLRPGEKLGVGLTGDRLTCQLFRRQQIQHIADRSFTPGP
jgi:hypothetical protein